MKYAIYALCVNAHKYSNCAECEFMQQQQPIEAERDQNQTSTSSEGMKTFCVFCGELLLWLQMIEKLPVRLF